MLQYATLKIQSPGFIINNDPDRPEMRELDRNYRNAQEKDCHAIARLAILAGGGFVEFLYHDLIPDTTPQEMLEKNLVSLEEPYSWRNAIVAEIDGKVAGAALSYPSVSYRITPEMERLIPKERLEHVKENFSARVEKSWFLDYLAVFPEFNGMGIGGKLIDLTKKRALEKGYRILSLSVFSDNLLAQRLYSRKGFVAVRKVELKSHELMPHEGGCLLMKCSLVDKSSICR